MTIVKPRKVNTEHLLAVGIGDITDKHMLRGVLIAAIKAASDHVAFDDMEMELSGVYNMIGRDQIDEIKYKEEQKVALIEYLTDILTLDPAKFVEFMGYDDTGRDIVRHALDGMNDEELNDTVKWYSDDYNDVTEFDEGNDVTTN